MALVADSTNSTTAWFTLAGAFGGVLLTSAVALTTAILNHRWQAKDVERRLLQEHVRALRQERRETYARYWSAWNRFNHQLRTVRDEVRKLRPSSEPRDQLAQAAPAVIEQAWIAELEWREAADALLLIGGQAVVEAAKLHMDVTQQRRDGAWRGEWSRESDAYQRLNRAMREELLESATP